MEGIKIGRKEQQHVIYMKNILLSIFIFIIIYIY